MLELKKWNSAGISPAKLRAWVAAKLFLIYAVLAIAVTSPRMPPTGDEPHYLVTAHSLAVDGDLELKNNYVNGDYRLFYPSILAKRTTLTPDHSELPAFGPGLSMFLTPFYWLAFHLFPTNIVFFLRLVMCSVAALAMYQLLGLLLRF